MSKCIILGSGASYGYDTTIPEDERPPLGKKVLSTAIRKGFLSETKYRKLSKLIGLYLKAKGLTEQDIGNVDMEEVLSWAAGLGTKSDQVPLSPILSKLDDEALTQIPEESKREFYYGDILHNGIGQAWYLMFELFRYYSVAYRPNFDGYQRLALHRLEEEYSVISLNYDVIFEMAIIYSQMNFSYPSLQDLPWQGVFRYFPRPPSIWPDSRKMIYISKIHGSVNWFNPVYRAISVGSEVTDLYTLIDKLGGFPYTNKFVTDGPRLLSPLQLSQITLGLLLPNGGEFYEPMLLPPIGNFKDFNKFDYLRRNLDAAGQLLSACDELVLIGTSLRQQDKDLNDLIGANSEKIKKVTIVAPPSDQSTLEQNVVSSLKPHRVEFAFVDSFAEYTGTL